MFHFSYVAPRFYQKVIPSYRKTIKVLTVSYAKCIKSIVLLGNFQLSPTLFPSLGLLVFHQFPSAFTVGIVCA